MRLFAVGIERARFVAVDCPQRSDARKKHPGDVSLFDRMGQYLGRGQNFRQAKLWLGNRPSEIGEGIAERSQLSAIGQRDRIVEWAGPAYGRLTPKST
jgi:hypothetical protein